jgi:hypothetical protein
MSFKEELERRRVRTEKETGDQAAKSRAIFARIKSRAAEVAQHLRQRGHDIGQVVDLKEARVVLAHHKLRGENYNNRCRNGQIHRAPDWAAPSGTLQGIEGTKKNLKTLADIDKYVLDFLEKNWCWRVAGRSALPASPDELSRRNRCRRYFFLRIDPIKHAAQLMT